MDQIINDIAHAISKGKDTKESPYPPDMQGQDGAKELTNKALNNGISAIDILQQGLMPGMNEVGERFSAGEAFIPELLIAAKAMYAALGELKPYFESGNAVYKGTVILGTVAGDLHDIGKNLVKMVLEGDGWQVIDLGVDSNTEDFVAELEKHPDAILGMSALLTTTMANMKISIEAIKEQFPNTKIFIGGAPVTEEFRLQTLADGYFKDPYELAEHLAKL